MFHNWDPRARNFQILKPSSWTYADTIHRIETYLLFPFLCDFRKKPMVNRLLIFRGTNLFLLLRPTLTFHITGEEYPVSRREMKIKTWKSIDEANTLKKGFERNWNEIVHYEAWIGKNRKERDRNEPVYRYRENDCVIHAALANIYSRGQSSNQLLKTTVAL